MRDRLPELRAAVEAFNRGDFSIAAEQMDEHIQWVTRLEAVDTPILFGREAVLDIWGEQIAALGVRYEVVGGESLGPGTFLSEMKLTGTGVASGITVEDSYWAVWTFRGDKVVRLDQYDTREAALADLA